MAHGEGTNHLTLHLPHLLLPCCSEAPALQQQHSIQQHMQQLPSAPQLAAVDQQQLSCKVSCKQQQVQELAQIGDGRTHWLLQVLGIGVVNILGLWAVLKVLQISKDSKSNRLLWCCCAACP
jgi:hypothetical protein